MLKRYLNNYNSYTDYSIQTSNVNDPIFNPYNTNYMDFKEAVIKTDIDDQRIVQQTLYIYIQYFIYIDIYILTSNS